MRYKTQVFTIVLILSFLLSSTMAFGDPLAAHTEMSSVQELNTSMSSEPTTLDFSYGAASGDIDVYNYMMEGLTRNSRAGKANPGIADSWNVSENGLVWTFHLRDATWTDGKEVTAEQFKEGWLRALNPKKPSDYGFLVYDILNAEEYSQGKVPAEQVGIVAESKHSLRITLKAPVTYFDSLVAMPVYSPIRTDLLTENGEYNMDPGKLITNGPFKLTSWEAGKTMVFEKNPSYWNKDNIHLNKVTGYIFNDISYSEKIDMYQKGNLDLIDYIDSTSYKAVGKNNIQTYLDGSVWYLSFNCSDKYLKNKNIRKALSYGINRSKYLNAAYPYRKYLPATALVAPDAIPDSGDGSFREKAPSLFKDDDQVSARESLKLGLEELKLKKLPTLTLLVNKNVLGIQGGEALSAMWKDALGIKIVVKAVTQEERLKKLSSLKYQITLDGWGPDYPDPMTYLNIFTTGNPMSHTNYNSAAYDDLIQQAKIANNKTEKFEKMHAAETLLMQEMPVCPLFFRKSSYSIKSYVKNVETEAFAPNINFIYSYIEAH